MTVEIRRGTDRFVDRAPGRRTLHAFSFGASYDPERVSFGPMVCHDEHLLRAGEGFDTHPHADQVIVSWVLSGALTHTDSTGASATLTPGEVGVLHAGDGVEHSEIAAAPQTRFVQVWLTPPAPAGRRRTTSCRRRRGPARSSRWPSRSPARPSGCARLEAGQTVTTPAAPKVHVFVARGALLRSSLAEPLHVGDAFLFTDEPPYDLTAGVPTELLCWTFE